MTNSSLSKEEMRINFFFEKNADVGAICDKLLELLPSLTAFNDTTQYVGAGKQDIFVAQDHVLQVFTDYKTFITLSPLTALGEKEAEILLYHMIQLREFTQMSAEPLILERSLI